MRNSREFAQEIGNFVNIQPNAVTVSNSHGILDPEGVVHRAQAEGLG